MKDFTKTRAIMLLVAFAVALVAPAVAFAAGVTPTVEHQLGIGAIVGVVGGLFIGTISDTTAQDKASYFALDTVRAQFNILAQDFNYFLLNNIAAATTGTYPGCTTATVTSQVKTANATVYLSAGVPKALGATDNFWTLTGAALAVSSFRRYLLLVDAAGVATVLASADSTVSAAACRWSSRPANGLAILGVLTVATDATHTFTPATTLLGAAGITATYIDGIDISVPLATLVSP
jgi:hypothetical protein